MLLQGPTLHDVQRALLYDATRCRVPTTHCRLTFVLLSARTRHVGIGLCRSTWPCGLRRGSLLPPFEIAPVRLLCRDVHRVAFETRGYYFAPSLSELPCYLVLRVMNAHFDSHVVAMRSLKLLHVLRMANEGPMYRVLVAGT